jgi:hypothetical protein
MLSDTEIMPPNDRMITKERNRNNVEEVPVKFVFARRQWGNKRKSSAATACLWTKT